jgi:hypothetical protein
MAYSITLIALGLLWAPRGQTWTTSVADLGVLSGAAPAAAEQPVGNASYPMQQQPQQAYAPQPQQSYTPQHGQAQQGYVSSAPTGTTTISSSGQYAGGAHQQGNYPQV